jgi:uncharacterized DUF497 family protein
MLKHGIDFAIAVDFDWEGAFVVEDDRFDYGETRLVAVGNIAVSPIPWSSPCAMEFG